MREATATGTGRARNAVAISSSTPNNQSAAHAALWMVVF